LQETLGSIKLLRGVRIPHAFTDEFGYAHVMKLRLVQRRVVFFPTLLGWVTLLAAAASVLLLWWFKGESYLSCTHRLPAEVLVVEGWIGVEGIREAHLEFEHGGYRYIVATSGLSEERWSERRYNFAVEAAKILLNSGIPRDRVFVAAPQVTEGQRTYEAAEAVSRALWSRNIHPRALNVFTMGVHARRSRLVFAKVFGPETEVGVIAWIPRDYEPGIWWHSSERAGGYLKETVAYAFEALLNSGRGFQSRPDSAPPESLPNK
jgi:uncharacterized SAM-binding protein YcdF (DUF218 family)